ncbi:MAG: hypothetical protein HY273_03825 [Gammaproteobacteria bacterium]|nr:hypothetical protein [Gammaproteobacteria bacterium]
MAWIKRCAPVICLTLSCSVVADEPPAVKNTPAEIMPITAANLRGHASLYHEGWFFISSTEKALAYAKQHSLTASGSALAQMQSDIKRHSAEYGQGMGAVTGKSVRTGVDTFQKGTALANQEWAFTKELAGAELDYGAQTMQRAWERFAKGNLTLAKRTEEDRKALANVPGDYFKKLHQDFSNLRELSDNAKQAMSTHIEGHWSAAFATAQVDFNKAYAQSGERSNSLSALGDIMAGYVKAAYSGLFKPAARSAVQGTEASVKLAANVIFLPVAGVFIVSGRTIESTGMSLYYATATGVKLVSPTVEGGLLAGLSLAAYSTVPVTYAVGGTVGAVSQIAVTTAAPVAGVGQAAVSSVTGTAVYAAQVGYDLVAGTTKVTLNQAQSGIALGYNALTAIPTQALLGAANSAIFLAWDGPRLVIAAAKGQVQWKDAGGDQSVPVQSVPVGTVVDLQTLGTESGVEIKVINDDPEVIQKVLENIPQDLRAGETK